MKKIISEINWQKVNNLVPAIIQDSKTSEVLMLGYMNKESLGKTFETKKVWFYSRMKKRLWMKGEKSGNVLEFLKVKLDCDNDTLLIKVRSAGPVCHTGASNCFVSKVDEVFKMLFDVIKNRKNNPKKKAYTTSLFEEGLNKICVKVAEESGELIKAATKESKQRLIEESVDLIYHLFVLFVERGVGLNEISKEILKRRKL